jgi:hypothetical protein
VWVYLRTSLKPKEKDGEKREKKKEKKMKKIKSGDELGKRRRKLGDCLLVHQRCKLPVQFA